MAVVHEVPTTSSDQRLHVLDPEGSCWCHPIRHVGCDYRVWLTHQEPTE